MLQGIHSSASQEEAKWHLVFDCIEGNPINTVRILEETLVELEGAECLLKAKKGEESITPPPPRKIRDL